MDAKIKAFLKGCEKSLDDRSFHQLILAKPRVKSKNLHKIVVSPVEKAGELQLKWEKFSSTQCFTDMHKPGEALEQLSLYLGACFREAYLWKDQVKWDLKISKKGRGKILKRQQLEQSPQGGKDHNRKKKDWIENEKLLQKLGILNASGRIRKNQGGKKRQINRFVELMSHLIRDQTSILEKKELKVADMGCGKGYLTFALYDYLSKQGKWKVKMTGVERRKDLVDHCNQLSREMKFEGLSFVCSDIETFDILDTDILVALHACDIATDEAIYKGIEGHSELIITAPCCHKELRPSIKSLGSEKEILKHGILAERQSELLTDALRALALESAGFKSKVFEFVSNQHTNKNLMVVGARPQKKRSDENSRKQMEDLMTKYGIASQRLYDLLYASRD